LPDRLGRPGGGVGPVRDGAGIHARPGIPGCVQLGSMIVLPSWLLVFGQVAGIMYFSLGIVLLLGAVIWPINLNLLWLGSRSFKRGYLIARV